MKFCASEKGVGAGGLLNIKVFKMAAKYFCRFSPPLLILLPIHVFSMNELTNLRNLFLLLTPLPFENFLNYRINHVKLNLHYRIYGGINNYYDISVCSIKHANIALQRQRGHLL